MTKQILLTKNRVLIMLSVVLFVMACKKDPSEIGLSIQPKGDQIGETLIDTFIINGKTVLDDSIKSYNWARVALGNLNDNILGTTSAQFISQFRLNSTNLNFNPDSAYIDSVYLYLKLYTLFGDSTNMNLKIFEITDTSFYSQYTKNTFSGYNSNPIYENSNFSISPKSGIIKILLPATFMEKFSTANSSNFVTNDAFLSFFKGLYFRIESQTQKGSMIIFEYSNTNITSYIDLKYRHKNDTAKTKSLKFNLTPECKRACFIQHNITGTELEQNLNDSLAQNLYIKPYFGSSIKFKLPLLADADSGKFIINRAQIIFDVNDVESLNYNNLSRIFIRQSILPQTPEVFTIASFVSTWSNNKFIFDVPEYYNNIIFNKTENYDLFLSTFFNYRISNRTILKNSAKFIVTYTKIK